MKQFVHLLKWDVVLLNRNRLFILAAAMAAIYIGIFYLIKPLGNLTIIVIVLIYNDPVITGFLFASVLLMFDKNQHMVSAITVLPIPFTFYLLSKTVVLATLAVLSAFVMAFATHGLGFNYFHLFCATFISAFMFSCFGFAIGAVSKTFNQLLLYSIPFFIITALPFLALFDVGEPAYYFLIPSTGGLEILRSAFEPNSFLHNIGSYGQMLIWAAVSWWMAVKATTRLI